MKRILILIIICSLHRGLCAQLSFGTKAGLNIPGSPKGNSSSKSKSISSSFGGFINYMVKNKIAVQAELNYSAKENPAFLKSSSAKGKSKSGQVKIPLTVQYKFSKRWYTEAGIQFKSTLSMQQKANGQNSINLKNFYKSGSWGLVFGSGYILKNTLPGLKIGFRYSLEFPKMNGTGGNDLKQVFNISLSYRLSKKQHPLFSIFKKEK
jgi:Outer membrane protein beta-barrel domain